MIGGWIADDAMRWAANAHGRTSLCADGRIGTAIACAPPQSASSMKAIHAMLTNVADEPIDNRKELDRLRDEAAATVAQLEQTRDAIEGELAIAREVLERVEKALKSS